MGKGPLLAFLQPHISLKSQALTGCLPSSQQYFTMTFLWLFPPVNSWMRSADSKHGYLNIPFFNYSWARLTPRQACSLYITGQMWRGHGVFGRGDLWWTLVGALLWGGAAASTMLCRAGAWLGDWGWVKRVCNEPAATASSHFLPEMCCPDFGKQTPLPCSCVSAIWTC